MAKRGLLEEYGHDTNQPQHGRAGCGGVEKARDVMNYHAPQIPGYDPHAHVGPGLGNRTVHHCGTQEAHGTPDTEGGRPGIHHTSGGSHHGHGTNRKGR